PGDSNKINTFVLSSSDEQTRINYNQETTYKSCVPHDNNEHARWFEYSGDNSDNYQSVKESSSAQPSSPNYLFNDKLYTNHQYKNFQSQIHKSEYQPEIFNYDFEELKSIYESEMELFNTPGAVEEFPIKTKRPGNVEVCDKYLIYADRSLNSYSQNVVSADKIDFTEDKSNQSLPNLQNKHNYDIHKQVTQEVAKLRHFIEDEVVRDIGRSDRTPKLYNLNEHTKSTSQELTINIENELILGFNLKEKAIYRRVKDIDNKKPIFAQYIKVPKTLKTISEQPIISKPHF
ncbi:hypothetical protein CDIK_4518, partial [Cucumispora dikerogammari]